MRRPLLFTAILMTTFTFLGHTAGAFAVPEPGDVMQIETLAKMKQTPVKMPFGPDQNLFDIQFGMSLCVSIYLLITAVVLIQMLKRDDKGVLRTTSAGLMGVGTLSGLYFFPLPAIFLIVAGLCGFAASFK